MTTWEPEDEAEFLRNNAMTISLDKQIAHINAEIKIAKIRGQDLLASSMEQWENSLRRLKRIEGLMPLLATYHTDKGCRFGVHGFAGLYETADAAILAALLKQVEEEMK